MDGSHACWEKGSSFGWCMLFKLHKNTIYTTAFMWINILSGEQARPHRNGGGASCRWESDSGHDATLQSTSIPPPTRLHFDHSHVKIGMKVELWVYDVEVFFLTGLSLTSEPLLPVAGDLAALGLDGLLAVGSGASSLPGPESAVPFVGYTNTPLPLATVWLPLLLSCVTKPCTL